MKKKRIIELKVTVEIPDDSSGEEVRRKILRECCDLFYSIKIKIEHEEQVDDK